MWRPADSTDAAAIVRMCAALYGEDPGSARAPEEQMERTLRVLREEPDRGRAVVLDIDGRVCGYALLIAFWSNEFGGAVCTIDELYVESSERGRRHATHLIEQLTAGTEPWVPEAVVLMLEVTPGNTRARRLYERLGFDAGNQLMRRRLRP